jgi:signal transduction histidine kinase
MAAPHNDRATTPRGRQAQIVSVAAQLPDGRWVSVRARVGGAQRIATLLAAQTVVLLILLLIPLMIFAWRVTRPLVTLARAAADTRPGNSGDPVPETGPEDVRSLTRAFNAMRQRILAMLADKDRMLGAIGHDLRTPLASLRVRVEQVGDDRLRERMVGTIEEMAGMLDDILSLARAGQPREAPEPTDLAALIGDTVADYQAMRQPVTLAGEGVLVTRGVRPLSLRRALRNLIDNAVKYGGNATVGLTEQADGAAVISVDDAGPGIPPDRVAEMMEPFARAEESRNRDTGGTGLGLALARSIAMGEGGRLELVNRAQGGLSARIVLPPE